MTVITKEENVFITPTGTVNFYTLDAPFGVHEAEFNEKGMVTNGKLSVRVLLDATDKGTKALLTQLKGNVSIKEVVVDGKILVQLSAGTKFKPSVANAAGDIIDAPTDVRINAGDVMKVVLSISEYGYEFEGKKAKALRLNAVKILEHDTSKREIQADEGTGKATFLDALNNTTDSLAAMKG